VWWDILLWFCKKFTAKSVGERILKMVRIWQSWEKYSGSFFPNTVYMALFLALFLSPSNSLVS